MILSFINYNKENMGIDLNIPKYMCIDLLSLVGKHTFKHV